MSVKYRIKNWHKFQHFSDRKPLWIKLYRDVLDDPEWAKLTGEQAKTLVMLWLLASDCDPLGHLPDVETIAFRLRITEAVAIKHLTSLSHWLLQDDISLISDGYQSDALETETETEKRREETDACGREGEAKNKRTDYRTADFETFWQSWPRKKAKADAKKAWRKHVADIPEIGALVEIVDAQKASDQWQKEEGQYIPYPATWLNAERWTDEDGGDSTGSLPGYVSPTNEEAERRLQQAAQLDKAAEATE